MVRRSDLKELEEFVDGQARGANQSPQSTDREFFMLRNRQIGALALLCQHAMAADLANKCPPGAFERLDGFLPGNVG